MMVEVKVPVLAESITEATLARWLKQPGDYVNRDENLVDMETDKVMLEIVAPQAGVIREIKKSEGANVSSDEVIALIDTAAVGDQTQAQRTHSAAVTAASEGGSITELPLKDSASHNDSAASEASNMDHIPLSPAVRKLVTENNLHPAEVRGSGKNGRITKGDVLRHISTFSEKRGAEESTDQGDLAQQGVSTQGTVASRNMASGNMTNGNVTNGNVTSIGHAENSFAINDDNRPEKRVPMSRLRARIASRLKDAQNTAAILTTFNEVNMQAVMALRSRYKNRFNDKYQVKLGFMSFFTKAAVEALKKFPIVNASVEEDDIIYHGYFDIGIAVGSPRGLVVPVLRNVDQMSFADIETAILDYGQKAKNGKLSLEELLGGTFSISNGGVYGSMMSTPILNPPQSAILGIHNIVERPVAEEGEIVIRPMMYLALSYDHRIIDGHDAVLFLRSIKESIEDPTRMLLEI